MERGEDMRNKGFISQQALDELKSAYTRARAKQSEDEAKLAKSEIRAPFAGVAGLRQVSEGAYVAAGTDIARLEKIDQLKLDFRVPETYLGQLKSGLAVSVAVDAFPQASFPGKIYAIEPAVDEQTRTVLARDKALVLRALKDLEFDRSMGKVSQRDFDEMSARLRARALILMKQLDEDGSGYRTIIERELSDRLAGRATAGAVSPTPPEATVAAAPPVAGLCACGTGNDADALFCKRCGSKL